MKKQKTQKKQKATRKVTKRTKSKPASSLLGLALDVVANSVTNPRTRAILRAMQMAEPYATRLAKFLLLKRSDQERIARKYLENVGLASALNPDDLARLIFEPAIKNGRIAQLVADVDSSIPKPGK